MTKIASNSFIATRVPGVDDSPYCPPKRVIVNEYGLIVTGNYSDNQLVKERDVKIITDLEYSEEGIQGQFYLTSIQSSSLYQDSYHSQGPYIKVTSPEYGSIVGEITNISVVNVEFTDEYGDWHSADYMVDSFDYTTNSEEGFLGIYPQNIVLEDSMGGSPSDYIDTFESGDLTLTLDFKLTCEGYYTVESSIDIYCTIIQRYVQ